MYIYSINVFKVKLNIDPKKDTFYRDYSLCHIEEFLHLDIENGEGLGLK